MRRFLLETLPAAQQRMLLPEDEARHARQVLRLEDGAEVLALDGSGVGRKCLLSFEGRKTWVVGQTSIVQENPLSLLPLTLEVALLKSEAMEWVLEKSV